MGGTTEHGIELRRGHLHLLFLEPPPLKRDFFHFLRVQPSRGLRALQERLLVNSHHEVVLLVFWLGGAEEGGAETQLAGAPEGTQADAGVATGAGGAAGTL